jgi:hypothetical protein
MPSDNIDEVRGPQTRGSTEKTQIPEKTESKRETRVTEEGDVSRTSAEEATAESTTKAPHADGATQKKKSSDLLRWVVIIGGIFVIFGLGVSATVFWPTISGYLVRILVPEQQYPPSQIEAVFVSQFDRDDRPSDVLEEWREARGDHKMIAYMIADCEGLGNINDISPNIFGSLLLDLTPSGDHRSALGITAAEEKAINLSPYERSILSLSDAIARARVRAAVDASAYRPNVTLWNWLTVGVSALATLLITIKSSWNPPPTEPNASETADSREGESKTKPHGFWVNQFSTSHGWYINVGVIAMVLSALGTVLASAKAFYDPTRSYVADQRALLNLQGLHRQVAYSVMTVALSQSDKPAGASQKCAGPLNDKDGQSALNKWSTTLQQVEAERILASLPITESDRNH